MSKPFVAIMMGSDSDLSTMQTCIDTLKELGVAHEAHVLSAHRTPDLTANYVKEAEQRGCVIFIAAAGLAAHLAGAVAANTIKPVIGIPLDAGSLGGLDALLATVQMPGGTPVATTTIGKAGAKNAAILAAEILAIQDSGLAEKLHGMRQTKREALQAADKKLQEA
ncbi:MAG: 5-(carboxyamino)imidazole ribonucleotide mutase [Coxiellaceae bacterium]|nr:5-(carboxyamino)imidazole ribonucleotide mutase [Coxiellaceae bacterium]